VRCCKLALDRGIAGALEGPSAYLMKSPPHQVSDNVARQQTEDFIAAATPVPSPGRNGHKAGHAAGELSRVTV
jgi:myo-inositol-1-phosphate synthase